MPSKNTSTPRRDGLGGWFKSSRSNPNGNQCVEVFFDVDLVHIRDSKDGGVGPFLTVPAADWATFLDEVVGRAPIGSNAAVRITTNSGGGADLRGIRTPDTTLSYTAGEWSAFVAGVRAAEFDLTSAPECAES